MSGAAAGSLLEISGLRHGYAGWELLRGVSLRLQRGEICVLVGNSGAGKTTLLRLVAGLERPRAGRVLLRDKIVADGHAGRFVRAEQRQLGMVFQDPTLWPHLSVRENVAIALPPGAAERAAQSERLLAEVGMAGSGRRRPETLSGGQKQRVALARALATGSDLLLLDEPLSALDAPVRDRLRPLIRDAVRRRNGSALMVSHDRTDAWQLADHLVVLQDGIVSQAGTPQALYTDPATEVVARYMGATGRVPVLGAGAGLVEAPGGTTLSAGGPGLGVGEAGMLLAYPEALHVTARGMAAMLVDCMFEGGRWRGRWRLTGGEGELEGLHDEPPLERANLCIKSGGAFAFSISAIGKQDS